MNVIFRYKFLFGGSGPGPRLRPDSVRFLKRYASFAMALGLIKPMFVSPCYKQIEGVLPISRSHVMSDNLVIQAQLLTGFDVVIQCDN